jgi:hypothetical protein
MSNPNDKSIRPSDPQLTTTAGNPVADNQNALSAGPRGPVLLQDYQLIEKLAHQNRERIPERPVHAKGWGAHGTLTITGDISKYTKAFGSLGMKLDPSGNDRLKGTRTIPGATHEGHHRRIGCRPPSLVSHAQEITALILAAAGR